MREMGVTIPDSISGHIDHLVASLQECLPFMPIEAEENKGFLDACIYSGNKIVQLAKALRQIKNNMYHKSGSVLPRKEEL